MRGIMFSEHFGLESAVLQGRKTQTRRIIKCSAECNQVVVTPSGVPYSAKRICGDLLLFAPIKQQYRIGEVVAIKQSYETIDRAFPHAMIYTRLYDELNLDKSNGVAPLNEAGWTNKMFVRNKLMPHRIKITSIRVERLQDISEEDCLKEGVCRVLRFTDNEGNEINEYTHQSIQGKHYYTSFDTPQQAFASLIDKVSGKGTWGSNPYVWVIDFELLADKTQNNEED